MSTSPTMFSNAEAYERFMGRWSRLLAPHFIEFVQLREGDVVLDAGSGTGALAHTICATMKSTRVTGIDRSREYVSYATQKAQGARAQFELGDVQRLTLPNARFDKTLSLLVLNFVSERARAMQEMMRVTKPGGVLAAAVWDYGEGMEMLRIFWEEARALDAAGTTRDETRMPLSKSGELTALWQQEGLNGVTEAPLTVALEFTSFDDYWAPFELGQGPAGAYVAELAAPLRAELAQRLRARLLTQGADGPFTLQAKAWAVKGTVPGA